MRLRLLPSRRVLRGLRPRGMRRSTVTPSVWVLFGLLAVGYIVVEVLHWLEKRQRR